MIITEKPPLRGVYIAHVGVKGMRWGVRRDDKSGSDVYATITITERQKKQATVALGAAAVVSVLYATGTLKPATLGSSKLALRGASAVGKLAGRGAGKLLSIPYNAITNIGRGTPAEILPKGARQRAMAAVAKLSPKLRLRK